MSDITGGFLLGMIAAVFLFCCISYIHTNAVQIACEDLIKQECELKWVALKETK